MNRRVRQRVEDEIIILSYRKLYNLPPNDPRVLDMTEYDMMEDLQMMQRFEKVIKNDDDDDDFMDDDDMPDSDKIFNSRSGNFDISTGYTKEELDEWMKDDSVYSQNIEGEK